MNILKIQGFEYFVSDTGRVFNDTGRELKRQKNKDGYWTVNLKNGDKYYHKRVNRLVATEFIKNPNNLPVVNHINHKRDDDNLENLEWVTHSENKFKSIENDWKMGKTKSHIDEVLAHKICLMIEEGYRNIEIELKLDVPRDTILDIRRSRSWREVSSQYKMQKSSRGVSEETVRWICNKLVDGLSIAEIVLIGDSKYITKSVVSKIRLRKTFVEISKDYF